MVNASSILWDPNPAFAHTHTHTHTAAAEEESMSQSYHTTSNTDNHPNLFHNNSNNNNMNSNNPSSETVKEVKEITTNNDNDNNEDDKNHYKSTTSASASAASSSSSSSFSVYPFSVNVPLNVLHPTTNNNNNDAAAAVGGEVSMDVNASMASSYAPFHPPAPGPAPALSSSDNNYNYNTSHNDHVGCHNSSIATSSNNAFAILDAAVPNFSMPSNGSNNFASRRSSQLHINNVTVAPMNTSGSNSVSTLAVLHDAMMHHANAVNDFSCNYNNHEGVGSKVTDKMDALSTNHNAKTSVASDDAHALLIEQVLLANKSNLKSKSDNVSHNNTTDGTTQQQPQQQQQQGLRRPLTTSNQKNERIWFEKFEELRQFRTEHGHGNVPQKYAANPQLGTWVHKQRAQYANYRRGKPSQITIERIYLMEAAGVQFPDPSGMLPRDNFVVTSSNMESTQKGMFLPFDIKH